MQNSKCNKKILLVNNNDDVIGHGEKIAVHKHGLLHRAFSVFCFDTNNSVLLQQRSHAKYHCPGLWTNTCCSHSLATESTENTAKKRLQFEMGINAELTFIQSFTYKATLANGLVEHEIDHVFISISSHYDIRPNPDEVSAVKWVNMQQLQQDIKHNPHSYTPWLSEALVIAISGYK